MLHKKKNTNKITDIIDIINREIYMNTDDLTSITTVQKSLNERHNHKKNVSENLIWYTEAMSPLTNPSLS